MSEIFLKFEPKNNNAYYIINDNSGSPSANYSSNIDKEGIIVIDEDNNTSADNM
ncbi:MULTISPECIES: hypothetical protein [unclassified Candidatus Frackibacter]|uniref:hypothetical protein n=1 Tax=unclassified Candidatus Frackibacter TaxID=2648818 RepID=UPI0008898A9A|nr:MULTISPECIES: hypothetical protein [unclassified Candidatus Frackibacter]SDC58086.1 hypothetical protein SAMN04515661_11475 [Candidatus Frackibacter sp. WG11]SEM72154.1 hypothetical protein SAMN04488698_11375 [Candidatus Frackibacter sp. WG12]SFL82082.1 hypothetical protein SAMN04488699_1158 [Candidatus Frackibacter sp. WG13]